MEVEVGGGWDRHVEREGEGRKVGSESAWAKQEKWRGVRSSSGFGRCGRALCVIVQIGDTAHCLCWCQNPQNTHRRRSDTHILEHVGHLRIDLVLRQHAVQQLLLRGPRRLRAFLGSHGLRLVPRLTSGLVLRGGLRRSACCTSGDFRVPTTHGRATEVDPRGLPLLCSGGAWAGANKGRHSLHSGGRCLPSLTSSAAFVRSSDRVQLKSSKILIDETVLLKDRYIVNCATALSLSNNGQSVVVHST